MSNTLHFFVAVPVYAIDENTDILYEYNDLTIGPSLRKTLISILEECECSTNYVRLWNTTEKPSYIKYARKPTPFSEIIPPDFVQQIRGASSRGYPIRITRQMAVSKSGSSSTTTAKSSKKKNEVSVKMEDKSCDRLNGWKLDELLCVLFTQQCQFISLDNKLLQFVAAWVNGGLQGERDASPTTANNRVYQRCMNVRGSCCFKHVIVYGLHLNKLGVLVHECAHESDMDFKYMMAKSVAKWYGDRKSYIEYQTNVPEMINVNNGLSSN